MKTQTLDASQKMEAVSRVTTTIEKIRLLYLPFLTVHMVRTSVKKLLKEGVIKVGVYNDSKFDHTHSYAFTGYGRDLMRP